MQTPSLRHALALRCPFCGHRPITAGFGELVEVCPACGHRFETEEGYWVGAMIVTTAVALLVLVISMAVIAALTWPDVPVLLATIVTMVVVALIPTWFYPRSKTVWIWLDRRVHPYEDFE